MAKVSVIVPHYNDLAGLDLCLSALVRQEGVNDSYEIIVADNMSPVDPAQLEAVIAGRARLVEAAQRGAGPARNAGVAAATGEILAFTDSDCVPERGWLAAGLRALDRHDIVGGRVRVTVDAVRPKNGVEAFEQVFAFDNARYIKKLGFSGAGNLFCARTVFDRVGEFRTGVSEDVDWSHRATALGYRLGYAKDAVVGHPARPDWASLQEKWRRVNIETYGLVPKTRLAQLRWLLRTWALPASIFAHAPRILLSPTLSDRRERLAALKTLVQLRLWRFIDVHRLLMRSR